MLLYADSFSCALNNDTGALVVNFYQKEPDVLDDGSVNVSINKVSSIIMEKKNVLSLINLLQGVYENNTTE